MAAERQLIGGVPPAKALLCLRLMERALIIHQTSSPHHKVSARSAELLESVGLEHRSSHRPDALSGGEQQRVAIARALINNPDIILADEPTGNLDSKHAEEIWGTLKRLSRDQGRTILAVTHEATGAVHADRVVVLRDGRNMGEIIPTGDDHVGLVSTRYQELAG